MNSLAMQIILPFGDPNGVKIIELTGWNGIALIVPRASIGNLKRLDESLNTTGIYFLFGDSEESDGQAVYIGESVSCISRLNSHNANKEFWNLAYLFIGTPSRKFLESVAIKKAKDANRFFLENTPSPKEEDLNDFDRIKNEHYFEGVEKILQAFEKPVFQTINESMVSQEVYYLKTQHADATANLLKDGTLLVQKGSLARKRQAPSFKGWAHGERKRLLSQEILIDDDNDDSYVLAEDVVFKSPSAAAAFISGRPANGWVEWKDDQGRTMDENLRK